MKRMGWIAAALAAWLFAPPEIRAAELLPSEKLARGKTHLAAKDLDDAAAIFRELALKSPDEAAGREAVPLYIRALTEAASHPDEPRESAIDELERDAPILTAIYCEPGRLKVNSEPCLELLRLQRELVGFRARQRVRKAGMVEVELAGVELHFWSRVGRVLCEKRLAGCEEMARAAFAASNDLEKNGRLAEAREIRRALRDPRNHPEKLSIFKRLLFHAAVELEEASLFEEAATAYEQIVEEPTDFDEAPRALQRAVTLRIALGHAAEARRNADLFAKRFAASHPEVHWHLAIALARLAAGRSKWSEARAGLLRVITPIDQQAPAHTRVLAHVWLARASASLSDGAGAARHYQSVRRAWKSPDEALTAMDFERRYYVSAEEVIEAVGEAVFFFAERRRAEVERLPMPVYKGPLRREVVLAFATTRLFPWYTRKTKAIEAVEKAYEEVLEIRPVPPPTWVIASAATVGSMWAALLEDSDRGVPQTPLTIPPGSGLSEKELRAAYRTVAGDSSDSRPAVRARQVFTMCLNTATKYAIANESSRRCEAWLAQHGRPPVVAVDELYPSPTLAGSAFAPAPAAPPGPTP